MRNSEQTWLLVYYFSSDGIQIHENPGCNSKLAKSQIMNIKKYEMRSLTPYILNMAMATYNLLENH